MLSSRTCSRLATMRSSASNISRLPVRALSGPITCRLHRTVLRASSSATEQPSLKHHDDGMDSGEVDPFHTLSDWSDDGSSVSLSDVQREFEKAMNPQGGASGQHSWPSIQAVREEAGRIVYSVMQGAASDPEGNGAVRSVAFSISRALKGGKGHNPWTASEQ